MSDFKPRLVCFYEKYAPEKVAAVDMVLKVYAGKEDDMFAALVEKYGPDPTVPSSSQSTGASAATGSDGECRDRLVCFYEKYAPEKVETVDRVLKVYAGKEDDMFAALVEKYGAEPPLVIATWAGMLGSNQQVPLTSYDSL